MKMEYNRIEKLVYEYLDSMVGGNPILLRIEEIDPSWSDSTPVENFYVNEVRVGSIRDTNGVMLTKPEIRFTIMGLFDLDCNDSYLYFRKWINKLERDDR